MVRAAALRSSALSLAKACSIGFRSGCRAAGRGAWRRPLDGLADAGDLVGRRGCPSPRRRRARAPAPGTARHRRGTTSPVIGPSSTSGAMKPVLPQAGDEGGGPPVAVRRGVDQALAPRAAAVAARHVGGGAGLVEEDEARRVHVALPAAPAPALGGDVGPVLLGRPQRLFLCRRPSRRSVVVDRRRAQRDAALGAVPPGSRPA